MGNILARLKGFQKLTSINDALKTWFDLLKINRCSIKRIPLSEAFGRVLAEDVFAGEDIPRFNRSAVDGYALRSENTEGTSQFDPTVFKITEAEEIALNQTRQVWTGNPIPQGANAVVMLEYTKEREGKIEVGVKLAWGKNVSRKGEDIRKGEIAAKAGTRLNPFHLGLLATLGIMEVEVVEKPKIGILATGDELVEVGEKLSGNQIFETNRIVLSNLCRELGAIPWNLGIEKDDVKAISEKLRAGLEKADGVITSGGTSVGGLDLVPEAVNNLGSPGVVVHGIAMRPGMPTALAVLQEKPVLVLSGNPVASVIGFEVFARPLIGKMLGVKTEVSRTLVRAVMTKKVIAALGRKTFVRVKVVRKNAEFLAHPVSARGSGAISTMTRGNGFVIVPENREGLLEGEIVLVRVFGDLEVLS